VNRNPEPVRRSGTEPHRRSGTEPVPIGDALARIQSELGLPNTDVLRALTERWSDVVGEEVAAHARLDAVRDGSAAIVVDGPIWASQLRYLEADIVERANALVGAGVVRGIRVRVRSS
jgi:predicted nucleic acid-binding Zn ribbon protein